MSFVLVRGAAFGANCWDSLIPFLDGPVVAVDLPGRGERADMDLTTVQLSQCADAIVEDVDRAGVDDIILVAHSFAGVSVPRAMPALADRLRHVVFLAAVVPPDGTRVLDQIDPEVRTFVEQSIDGGIYHQDRESAAAMLCNDLEDDRVAWVLDRIVSDSSALLAEPVDVSGLRVDVPRTYAHTALDRCYVPELQDRSASIVGGSRVTLQAGHMPMVSMPQRLAAVLTQVGN